MFCWVFLFILCLFFVLSCFSFCPVFCFPPLPHVRHDKELFLIAPIVVFFLSHNEVIKMNVITNGKYSHSLQYESIRGMTGCESLSHMLKTASMYIKNLR